MSRPSGGALLALLLLWGAPAWGAAEPSPHPEAPDPAGGDDALSPEELAEIRAALGADAAVHPEAPAGSDAPPAGSDAGSPPGKLAGSADPGQPGPTIAGAPRPGLAGAIQSMNPDMAFIADFALAAFSDPEPLQAGAHDPHSRGFNLQQLELAASGFVDPYFRFDANLVFSQFGVEVEEVYATSLAFPAGLQLRVGQFLTRFGRLNATHPHSWAFVDQALVIGKFFGGEGNRGLGAELSWLTPLPWYAELVGSVTDGAGAASARSFWGADVLDVTSPLDTQLLVALKQFFPLSADWSLMAGVSATTGPNPSGLSNRTDVYGADLFLKWRPVSTGLGEQTEVVLQAEWMLRRRQLPGEVLQDHGGYAYLVWRFMERWAVGLRGELVTGVEGDPLDPFWSGDRRRVSADLTFWPTEFSRLRLQGSVDHPTWREPIYAALLAAEFSVGAHGAHAF